MPFPHRFRLLKRLGVTACRQGPDLIGKPVLAQATRHGRFDIEREPNRIAHTGNIATKTRATTLPDYARPGVRDAVMTM